MDSRRQRLQVVATAALAVVGFGASFGVARVTRDEAKPASPAKSTPSSVAVLPAEAARLVRLAPGGALPALRPPPTTVRQPSPTRTQAPTPTRAATPTPTTAAAPKPATTAAPKPTTTYIP